jgi:Tfp pilus assembly protein PilV
MNANGVKGEAGFTIIEVIIAVIVLTVGLLGLVTTSALVTRMMSRGQRSEVAAIFAQQRMERLRPAACIAAQRVPGSEPLYRGSVQVARNSWTFTPLGANTTVRITVLTDYITRVNRTRTDTLELEVTCLT